MWKRINMDNDKEHFTYNRTWEQIEDMLDQAERKQNHHYIKMQRTKNKKDRLYHMKNYKALEGVIKALRWTLGDKNIKHPLE